MFAMFHFLIRALMRTPVNLRFGDLDGDTHPYRLKDYQRKAFRGKYATIRCTENGPFIPIIFEVNLSPRAKTRLEPAKTDP
jgi:hypothetical protein